jgi:hypothetical protein
MALDMQSDTGQNDPNSIWGSGNLLSTLGKLAGTAGDVYSRFTGKTPAAAPPPTAAPATSTSSWQKYLPWAIGGVVVLVVVALVFKRR